MTLSPRSPNLMQRLQVLRETITRERLLLAREMVQRDGLKGLFTHVMLHTSYRWRMRKDLGSEVVPEAAAELYEEEIWPADLPLVSVVIPCFNYGKFVTEAVDSVLAQTLRDVEIIVVEGGSTDGVTPGILRALQRPRTTVLFREQRHRIGSNRNFGISHARGRYICCLDADDKLRPTYLEKAVFLLEHGGYDVVSTAVQRFGAVDEKYGVLPAPDLADLLQGNHVATCAVFRRSLWEDVGGYQDSDPAGEFLHEDWRFWIRLASQGARFRNMTGEHLFLYRAHANGSLSTGQHVLPDSVQAKLLREVESRHITKEAMALSREQAERRLRAPDGPRNLLERCAAERHCPTILVAMPFLVLGGAERLLSEILRHLRRRGYRLTILTTLQTMPEHGDTTEWFEPATDEIYHLPRFLAADEYDDFIDYVLAAKRVDALWIVGSAMAYESLPRIRERFPRIHVVDLLFNTIGHAARNRRYSKLIDMNLVENDEVRRWLLSSGETGKRVRLVSSGIDLERYKPALRSRRMAESVGIGADTFIAGFSGRLSEEKAPLAFLNLARRFADSDDVAFVMTGAGPMEGEVRRSLASFSPAGRVHFLGMVPEVRDWLACYDVLVVPSDIDGRPTVVLEALAMGIPVVASAVGGLPELIQDGETGFLCPAGDEAAFANAIARLRADPVLHAKMRAAARRFAERELRFERTGDAYAAVFDELLARRQPALRTGQERSEPAQPEHAAPG
jgi:glycosyltransferase involved in cell wall biosynthesis